MEKDLMATYEDKDFFVINDGEIRLQGYFYSAGDGTWRCLQYSGFYMPLEKFLKYESVEKALEAECLYAHQYIDDFEENEVLDAIQKWLEGTTPIKVADLKADQPDGDYVFVD